MGLVQCFGTFLKEKKKTGSQLRITAVEYLLRYSKQMISCN